MAVSGLVYQDKNIIDTIKTNGYGMGKFTLTPVAGSNYYVRLYAVNKQDTLYKLPTALTQGPVITLQQAVVNDTLMVTIHDEQHKKLYLIGHNYKQLLFAMPVIMAAPNKKLRIIIKKIPKGLTQLTVTDSLGRPFAERVFFAHYDQKTPLHIATTQDEYATRQKVNVRVRMDAGIGKADSGFVSVACVQDNRIEIRKQNDIESYVYLKCELGNIPLRETYLGNTDADKQYLENILLIKGWRRYTWVDVLNTTPIDTIRKKEGLVFKGTVTKSGKPLKQPVEVAVIGHSLTTVSTDNAGNFILYDDAMVTDPGKKAAFSVNGHNTPDYRVHVVGPYPVVYEKLAKQLEPINYSKQEQENTLYMQLIDNENAIHLNEVKIKGGKNNSFYATEANTPLVRTIDRYSIRTPFGKVYIPNRDNQLRDGGMVDTEWGKKEVTRETINIQLSGAHLGENINMYQFTGIYLAQEFYPADYSAGPSGPQYLSTLYWKHLLKITAGKYTEFSFDTSDITGRFKIVIQGVTGNDVVYGEKIFNVVKLK